MLRYHVAYYMPKGTDRMVVAEAVDFAGVMSQGFDLADARSMIASAMTDMAEECLQKGIALPIPNPEASAPDADLLELVPLTIEAGAAKQ